MRQLTESPKALSKKEARTLVSEINRDGIESANRIRSRLYDFYVRRGWEALGYSSWRECAVAEFRLGEANAYNQLTAARIERSVSTIVEKPMPEAHARELSRAPEDKWQEAYDAALATAPDGQMTARHLHETLVEMKLVKPWGERATNSNMADYIEAMGRMTLPQIEGVLRKCFPSIPARVLFKAVDEVRYMTHAELSEFNNQAWSAERSVEG